MSCTILGQNFACVLTSLTFHHTGDIILLQHHGGKEADSLAWNGRELPQMDLCVSFDELKTILRVKYKIKWERQHPVY